MYMWRDPTSGRVYELFILTNNEGTCGYSHTMFGKRW
jgi:hypothetical protein